jgi:hypothetical protein
MAVGCVGPLTAADVLDRFKGDIRAEILKDTEQPMTELQRERMSVFKIIGMLRATATECLLKALWLKHGGKLAQDGKYLGVVKKNEHVCTNLLKRFPRKVRAWSFSPRVIWIFWRGHRIGMFRAATRFRNSPLLQ